MSTLVNFLMHVCGLDNSNKLKGGKYGVIDYFCLSLISYLWYIFQKFSKSVLIVSFLV